MARDAHHEGLSAHDAAFPDVEAHCSHMHIGSVGGFESGLSPTRGIAAAVGGGLMRESARAEVAIAVSTTASKPTEPQAGSQRVRPPRRFSRPRNCAAAAARREAAGVDGVTPDLPAASPCVALRARSPPRYAEP